jgi:hypothetical protein
MSEAPSDPPGQEVLPPQEIEDAAAQRLIHEGYQGHIWGLFLRRITSEHITQMNEEEARENDRAHWRYMTRVGSGVVVLVIVLVFIGYLVEKLAPTNPELLKELIQIIVAFAGGACLGAGGTAVYMNRKKNDDD